VTGYRSHVVRLLNLLVILYSSDTQYSSLSKQKHRPYNVIISHTVQLWLLFKNVISFRLNSIVEQYIYTISLQSLGRFLWATRYRPIVPIMQHYWIIFAVRINWLTQWFTYCSKTRSCNYITYINVIMAHTEISASRPLCHTWNTCTTESTDRTV